MTVEPRRPRTAAERSMAARIAANSRWSREDGRLQSARMRAGMDRKFEREVDPDGVLEPRERARRVANARRAHYQRLSLAAAKARRKGNAAGDAA